MLFDQELYYGIFCYSLIHLLDEKERLKLIDDCYRQLAPNGYMFFVAISKGSPNYGIGQEIGPDQFATPHGVKLFFYDLISIQKEFGEYGLIKASEVTEPFKSSADSPMRFWEIICKKKID